LNGLGPNVKPREGAALAALSSGIARAGRNSLFGTPIPNGCTSDSDAEPCVSPEGARMCTFSTAPTGFPVSSFTTCGNIPQLPNSEAFDGIALELLIRAPTNAKSFAFEFDFYTFEYTQYVCGKYNDEFVALLFSKSPDVPANHNIAFDSQKNAVCVNNAFLEVCEPYEYDRNNVQRSFPCRLGTSELEGTGFDADRLGINHAATG
jgi:hypothetical protein